MFLLVLRVALGGLFLFAAYNKLRDPQQFAFSIKAFDLVPDGFATFATFAVPWTEIVVGTALVLGVWARSAAALLMLMLAVFIAAFASVLYRGMDVTCGCFGKFEVPCKGPVGACHIARNAVLFGLAGIVAWGGGGLLAACPERSAARPA